MSFEAVFTLGVLAGATILFASEVLSPDVILLGALAAVTAAGIIDLDAALHGFANSALLAIGALYVVAAGLREAGVLERAAQLLLGSARDLRRTLARLVGGVAACSAFLNNTPVVAMGIPAVRAWAQRHGIGPSKLLMPLAFGSVLGGICTLIGTSTNLVTDGLLRRQGMEGLGFFELAWAGVPCALVGIVYLVTVGPSLLPPREEIRAAEEREQATLLELELATGSPLAGRTVEEAGLDRLPGLSLVRIDRAGRRLGPVPAQEELTEGDHLFYAPDGEGDGEREPELEAYPGLRLALGRSVWAEEAPTELHEAVVREGSSLVGSRVKEVGFLERFGAAVTGVRRGGSRLEEPIGEIALRPGDTLMLDTGPRFREAFEDSPEFYVATEAGGEAERTAPEPAAAAEAPRGWLAVGVLGAVILLAVTGVFHIALAALLGAVAMVGLGLLTPGEARQAVDWSVLLVIGAAFGLAAAMESSGAAEALGAAIVQGTGAFGPLGLLAGAVLATMVLTGFVTNNAAAALLFPIVVSVAISQALDPRPFVIAMTIMASLPLWTPLGYHTFLMVYGPGNYRFTDFTRVGLPLQLLLGAVLVAVVPLFWPL